MTAIERLRAQLKSQSDAMVAITDLAEKENRDLTAEEQKKIAELSAAFESTKAQLDARVKAQEARETSTRSMGRKTTAAILGAGLLAGSVTGGEMRNDDPARNGFRDIAEFALSVKQACAPGGVADPRLSLGQGQGLQAAPSNYQNATTGADGGFAVPPAMREDIWSLVEQADDVLNWIEVEPTDSISVQITKDETTPWGGSGITAYWRSEAGQMTGTKAQLKQDTLYPHDLYAFVSATDELLADASRLSSRLTSRAAAAIVWTASEAIVNGNGVGKPRGWFLSDCLVSVAKETSQTADTINATNIAKMYSRLLRVPGSSPFWLINSDAVPQLMLLTISNQPIWTPPSSGFAQAPGGFLLGLPVRLSEHAKTVGDKGDIQLIEPAGYYAVQRRGGIQAASSIHLYFDYGVTAFRWTTRLGGQPFLSGAVSPANGSATKSHFVTLDERA